MAGLSFGGLVLNILIYFVSSEGDRFGLIPDFVRVVTHLNNLYLLKHVKTDDLGLCCCLEMYVTTTVCAPMLDSSHIYWQDFFHIHTGNCLINALSGVISSYTLTPPQFTLI